MHLRQIDVFDICILHVLHLIYHRRPFARLSALSYTTDITSSSWWFSCSWKLPLDILDAILDWLSPSIASCTSDPHRPTVPPIMLVVNTIPMLTVGTRSWMSVTSCSSWKLTSINSHSPETVLDDKKGYLVP